MTDSATRRAPTLDARLDALVHAFIYRPGPDPHAVDYRREREIRADTENTALFHLLGQLIGLVNPHARTLAKARVVDAAASALDYALTQEHAKYAQLGVALAAADDRAGQDSALRETEDPPVLVVHSLTLTGLCASDCPACD